MLTIAQLLTDHLTLAHMFLLRTTCKKIYFIYSHEDIIGSINEKYQLTGKDFIEILLHYGKRETSVLIKNDDIAAFSVIYPDNEKCKYTPSIKYLILCDKAAENKAVKIFKYVIYRATEERNVAFDCGENMDHYNDLLLNKALKSDCDDIRKYLLITTGKSIIKSIIIYLISLVIIAFFIYSYLI